MKSAYQIIRRPVITEKGLGAKESEATLVFEVAAKASKSEIKRQCGHANVPWASHRAAISAMRPA